MQSGQRRAVGMAKERRWRAGRPAKSQRTPAPLLLRVTMPQHRPVVARKAAGKGWRVLGFRSGLDRCRMRAGTAPLLPPAAHTCDLRCAVLQTPTEHGTERADNCTGCQEGCHTSHYL